MTSIKGEGNNQLSNERNYHEILKSSSQWS